MGITGYGTRISFLACLRTIQFLIISSWQKYYDFVSALFLFYFKKKPSNISSCPFINTISYEINKLKKKS
jgi:hypothetical protein